MGKRFQKFCEWFNDCKYVPVGSRCGACGKKLNFFFTGFWSVNNQRYNRYLSDGVLCAKCKENAENFIKSRKKWMSKELQAQDKWQKFDARNMDYYSVSDIKALMEQKELSDKENLSTYGSEACGLFEIRTSFGANTHPLQVGIVRDKKLKNKTVVFGTSEESTFRKGDRVKVTLRFRGREMAHVQSSKQILDVFAEKMKDVAVVEKAPKLEGRNMSMFLTEKR